VALIIRYANSELGFAEDTECSFIVDMENDYPAASEWSIDDLPLPNVKAEPRRERARLVLASML
jgi:hypothetical protein